MNFFIKLREHPYLSKLKAAFIGLYALSSIILQFANSYTSENTFVNWVIITFYFTTQSNFLVFVVLLLFTLNQNKKPYFKYLAFIALFNISITALIFHTLLTGEMTNIGYMQHALHTIVPLLYILFYYLIISESFKTRHAWVALIYPLVFSINVYLWKEPLFGNYIDLLYDRLPGMRYIYPFFDPSQYPGGTLDLILFLVGLLTPLLTLLSYGLLLLKNIFEKNLNLSIEKRD